MTLEIRLDETVLYKASFPVCRADRDSVESQGQKSRSEFSFRPQRAIVWSEYRDKPDCTAANISLEGDVWQAGADPEDLLIGISFMANETIYMNTMHIARPGQRDRTEIAPGLVVTTYPESN